MCVVLTVLNINKVFNPPQVSGGESNWEIVNAHFVNTFIPFFLLRPRDHKKRLLFQIGDKISCTRNTYLKDLLPDPGFRVDPNHHECNSGETTLTTEAADEGKRLCNGDIFFITEVSPCCKDLHKNQW